MNSDGHVTNCSSQSKLLKKDDKEYFDLSAHPSLNLEVHLDSVIVKQ